MDSKFFQEALFAGMTGNGFKLGTVLALGFFWMRPAGCHTIYRGQDGVMDYDDVQAVMDVDDSQVSIAAQDLPPGTIWHYIRRQVSGCGLESGDSPACIVRIDDNGDMIGDMPNVPSLLVIEVLSGGRFKLRWHYNADAQEVAPTGFNIYMDSGSGFNFDSSEATVPYRLGRSGDYEWTSGALSHGRRYRFVVRSDNTSNAETYNTNDVSAIADSQGPDAITDLQVSWEDI